MYMYSVYIVHCCTRISWCISHACTCTNSATVWSAHTDESYWAPSGTVFVQYLILVSTALTGRGETTGRALHWLSDSINESSVVEIVGDTKGVDIQQLLEERRNETVANKEGKDHVSHTFETKIYMYMYMYYMYYMYTAYHCTLRSSRLPNWAQKRVLFSEREEEFRVTILDGSSLFNPGRVLPRMRAQRTKARGIISCQIMDTQKRKEL